MEEFKGALLSLTQRVCRELEGQEIPKEDVWTVVDTPGATPHVALDVDRPALSGIRFSLSLGLFRLPEYRAVADAAENDAELRQGIIIDAAGYLRPPERTNVTRALVTNFLWRYLREGKRLDWDETRFNKTFDELISELAGKSVLVHSILPLSSLKVAIDALDFSEELKLRPASLEELEGWLNPDRTLGPLAAGPPRLEQLLRRPARCATHAPRRSRSTSADRPPGPAESLAEDQC